MPHCTLLFAFVLCLLLQAAHPLGFKSQSLFVQGSSTKIAHSKAYGSGALGFSMRLTSANFRVFFALPMLLSNNDCKTKLELNQQHTQWNAGAAATQPCVRGRTRKRISGMQPLIQRAKPKTKTGKGKALLRTQNVEVMALVLHNTASPRHAATQRLISLAFDVPVTALAYQRDGCSHPVRKFDRKSHDKQVVREGPAQIRQRGQVAGAFLCKGRGHRCQSCEI